jgi:hypothetical protein
LASTKFGFCGVVALSLALSVFVAAGAVGLIVENEEQALNYQAPADDPGWANVGVCNRWTAVYLGRGWVLTAAHVGPSNINLDGTMYAANVKSRKRVLNRDGSAADLVLFRIDPEPDLPAMKISADTPPIGSPFVMVGSGLGRGEKMEGEGRVGFFWQAPSVKRWGTSVVSEQLHDQSVGNTDTFTTRFSIARTAHEAQAAHGDSGGAAFAYIGDRWQLVGIILAVDNHIGQPYRSAVYGNRTIIADLARYSRFIQSVTGALSD